MPRTMNMLRLVFHIRRSARRVRAAAACQQPASPREADLSHAAPSPTRPRHAGTAVRRHRTCAELHRKYGDARPGRLHSRTPRLRSRRAQCDLAHAHGRAAGVCEAGRGRLQIQGQPIKELRVGESAFIPGGSYHWHGAAPNENFTMMFITMGQSKTSQGEPVTEEVYLGRKK